MAMSSNSRSSSDSWSTSDSRSSFESYNSHAAGRGSCSPLGSQQGTRLQRFMQNILGRLKRVKCVTSAPRATQGWYRLESSDSDSDQPLRPLSGALGANIQRSVGETGSDETVLVMNMVIQIPPGINNETVMYEMKDTTSLSDAENFTNIKFGNKSLAAILLSKEPAFVNLNFPQLQELIDSFSERKTNDDSDNDNDDSKDDNTLYGEPDGQVTQDLAGNSCSVTHLKGELRVFKSGRATLSFGSKVFVLSKAANSRIIKKVAYLDIGDRLRYLGLIKYYIDVLPQEESKTKKSPQAKKSCDKLSK